MDDRLVAVISDYLAGRRSLEQAAVELRALFRETGWQINLSADADPQSDEFKSLSRLLARWQELDQLEDPEAGLPVRPR